MQLIPVTDEGTKEGRMHERVTTDCDVSWGTVPITDGISKVTKHFQLIGILLALNGKMALDHDLQRTMALEVAISIKQGWNFSMGEAKG